MNPFDEAKVDAHCHLLDPARFPYAPDVAYRPAGQEVAPLEQLLAVMDAYGIRHALLVGPNSGYSLDNRCMLDALARHRERFRGVAVVRNDISSEELAALKAAGVVGVAFNATVLGTAYYEDTAPLLARLQALGLFVQVQAEHEQWLALEPLLMRSEVPLLIDHGGRPRAGAGVEQPGFQGVLRLARRSRTAIKLSGYQKFAQQPPPYDDARPFVDALLQHYGPDACLWASDWPFLKAPQRLDVGPLVQLLANLVPDADERRRIWWDTPRRWMGLT